MKNIRIGTRGSQLALWQSEFVAARLREEYPDLAVELVKIKTTGDKILDAPLAKIGDKGLFVKEIEVALLSGDVDIAVHSAKDMPTEIPAELILAAYLKRDDPSDALISRRGELLDDLPTGAVVGTSSLRRRAQLAAYRPDLKFVDLRGNVDTRLRKLDEENLDAILLSGAGLIRLGWGDRITERIKPAIVVTAVGQGLIVIETRQDNAAAREMVAFLDDAETSTCVRAERIFSDAIGGGCQVPMGAYAVLDGANLHMDAVVASVDGTRVLRDEIEGPAADAQRLALEMAGRLLDAGARDILDEIRQECE